MTDSASTATADSGRDVAAPRAAVLIAVLFFMPVFPTFLLIDWLDVPNLSVRPLVDDGSITALQAFGLRLVKFFLLALPASLVFIFATVLLSAFIRWALLPKMKAGSWPIHSNRIWPSGWSARSGH